MPVCYLLIFRVVACNVQQLSVPLKSQPGKGQKCGGYFCRVTVWELELGKRLGLGFECTQLQLSSNFAEKAFQQWPHVFLT
jgi:hypothetical protein